MTGKNPAEVVSSKERQVKYFSKDERITVPSVLKRFASRLAFPLLCLLSREQTLKLGLTPIDDERVIMALKHANGKVLDVGCGANNFIHSYGDGIGVDVVNWDGCDVVVKDTADLPFKKGQFGTVSFLACLNHIPNRNEAVKEAFRVTKPGGQVLVTMITPKMGAFIHWLRFRNDPDHQSRDLDHSHELMGMSSAHIRRVLEDAGYTNITRKRFVYGLNSLYIGHKALKTKP